MPLVDAGVEVNPFWSERVVGDILLQQHRPRELPPVPDGSVETRSRSGSTRRGAQLGNGKGVGVPDQGAPGMPRRKRSRSSGRKEGRGSGSTGQKTFRTPPSSWSQQGQERGQDESRSSWIQSTQVQDQVERELEREVFEFFKEENARLKKELETMKMKGEGSAQSSASWSAVDGTRSGYVTPPPPPVRRIEESTDRVMEPRFTPNGTQVPLAPPPEVFQEVQQFPYEQYEVERAENTLKWLGPQPPKILHPGDRGGGRGSRQEQVQRRAEQGGHQSRVEWLDSEEERLRAILQERYGSRSRFQDVYWATPASQSMESYKTVEELEGARQQLGRELRAQPLSRAHGEVRGASLSRAYDELAEGERYGHEGGDPRGKRYHGKGEGHHQHPGGAHGDHGGESSSETDRRLAQEQETRKILEDEVARLKQRLEEQSAQPQNPTRKEIEGQGPDKLENSLKGVAVKLPKLTEPGGKNASLEAGDWLAQIRPYIADVGPGAERWWDTTTDMVMKRYGQWLEANPLERVHIKAPELDQGIPGSDRLNQRVTTLLLSAVPETIRSELVTTRQLSVTGVLFAILRRYQPGGLAEKTYTLSELTNTSAASSAAQAVQKLRHWKRQQTRALELGLTLPDPLILVKALDVVMSELWSSFPQASFRMSAFRMQEQIDVRPTMTTLEHFYDLLLSEADQMVYGRSGESQDKDSKAAVKMLQQTPPRQSTTPSTSLRVCTFWGTEKGCRLGRACKFHHDWQGLEDKQQRCWCCSATTHLRSECPTRGVGGSGYGGYSGGYGYGEDKEKDLIRDKEKDGDKKGKGKYKGKEKSDSKGGKGGGMKPSVNKAANQSTSPSTSTTGKDEKEENKEESDLKTTAGTTSTASAGKDTEGLVAEVTSLLKSMRVAQGGGGKPALSAIKLRKMEAGRQTTVLLDGGATISRCGTSTSEFGLWIGIYETKSNEQNTVGTRGSAADSAFVGPDQHRSVN